MAPTKKRNQARRAVQERIRNNGAGITWRNVRDSIYTRVGTCVPRVLNRTFTAACQKAGVTKNSLYSNMMFDMIREHLGEDELNALQDYLEAYFPPGKSPEVKAYWLERVGITLEEEPEPEPEADTEADE